MNLNVGQTRWLGSSLSCNSHCTASSSRPSLLHRSVASENENRDVLHKMRTNRLQFHSMVKIKVVTHTLYIEVNETLNVHVAMLLLLLVVRFNGFASVPAINC